MNPNSTKRNVHSIKQRKSREMIQWLTTYAGVEENQGHRIRHTEVSASIGKVALLTKLVSDGVGSALLVDIGTPENNAARKPGHGGSVLLSRGQRQ